MLAHGELLGAELSVKDRVVFSRAQGELLRVELSVKEESELCRELFLREKATGLADGGRDWTLVAGDVDRLVDGDRLTGVTAKDRREACSTSRSLLMVAIGSCASEADR